jgi:hypothetical protein
MLMKYLYKYKKPYVSSTNQKVNYKNKYMYVLHKCERILEALNVPKS